MTYPKPHRTLRPGMSGDDVRAMQDAANHRLQGHGEHGYIVVDGDLGPQTVRGCSRALYLEGVHGRRFRRSKARNGGHFDRCAQEVIRWPSKRSRAMRLLDRVRAARIRRAAERARKHARHPLGEGVDYAWGYHRGVSAELMKAHKHFVMRYLSTPGNSKNLTQAEALDHRNHGLAVGIVFETTAGRALSGHAGGAADAHSAQKQLFATGLPNDTPIYFAVDFDASPAQQAAINAYLAGAASVLGYQRTGVYGSYYVVRRALEAGACKYAWQTYAWSGGLLWRLKTAIRTATGRKIHGGAHLYQYRNGVRVAGVACDLTRALQADAGLCVAPPLPGA